MVVLWILIALAALIAAYFLFLTVCGLFVDVNKEYDRNRIKQVRGEIYEDH